ncbi:BTAD domain-containing putative transcriptional regulator [Actinocorallia sp. A-T 12471]|uniref:AfsR/SARP family transcriptional regulator n=1 Tax=Actinocorallia sp. A-T 12471 TaxID=3089813 RepID=UPI0029CC10C5|nr:BTAD domain-containing putative transcriptional regulator [Actinocorallia sp. A-T 12471]MDX6743903.1 BTAD domain-containing putative transcriptional regulator [Actinocorallia sp. A-T 12471]
MGVFIGVLGPVAAWDAAGSAIALKGPRHREVLARLVAARGRVVPVELLAADLWEDPPEGAIGSIRTFVGALRRALEPDRPPRTPPSLIVTVGTGYALRAEAEAVDAWRFERAVEARGRPSALLAGLDAALALWRGPAYSDFARASWAEPERARLAELRSRAVERRAQALLELGRAAEAVPDLDAHTRAHPWREESWRLLALAFYRAGRQADALAVLRRARRALAEEFGLDPGPGLRDLETDILRQAARLDAPGDAASRVWASAAAAHDRAAPGAGPRLEATVGLMRGLAVTGADGLVAAREHRAAAVEAAEELGDAELTARVIGAYDVPAIWTRADDPVQVAGVVAAAERALAGLPDDTAPGVRARLLATVGLESRGTGSPRARAAALEAERIARGLDDPALLAFALNARFMQSFETTGLSGRRDGIGAEIAALAVRHGMPTYEVLGRLIGLQSAAAVGDFARADRHAALLDGLAERHDRPLVTVFTTWYRALRLAESPGVPFEEKEAAVYAASGLLDSAGMPGLSEGLPALAVLALRHGHAPEPADPEDFGPYRPWALPVLLLAAGRRDEAALALREAPDPPHDLLAEALWTLLARAALELDDVAALHRAHAALRPAAGELAGAASGLLSLGPVAVVLADLEVAPGF